MQLLIYKRKLHVSALILAGSMTRDEALEELKKPVYPEGKEEEDTEYLIKKFNVSEEFFEKIMNEKPKTFLNYKTNYPLHVKLRQFLNNLRSKGLYHK